MSNAKDIVSTLVLSALLLSPFAMAEESQTFAARNESLHASLEQRQVEIARQAKDHLQTQQASTSKTQTEAINHS